MNCFVVDNLILKKIPKLFYDSKVINVIKNKDAKCFIYCYIRKFLNPVNKHSERVSLKDKEFVKKLEDELEYNFDKVKIKDIIRLKIYLKLMYMFIRVIKT